MKKEQLIKNLNSPKRRIDVVLDTDAYCEIDDQYAIVYMMKQKEKLNVKAIFAAPFYNENSTSPKDGMEKSYMEINNLLDLMCEKNMKEHVFCGATNYLQNEETPVISDASRYLSELADQYSSENPLYVVGIGTITNIASAILMKPEIAEKIVIVWLGGNSREYIHTAEFNMMQDVAAARVVFSSGAPIVQLPCFGVVSAFSISRQELEYFIQGKSPVCDYLVKHTIDAVACDEDWTRIIWDVTAIGWLVDEDESFMKSKIVNVKMPTYENLYENEVTDNLMRYVYYVDRDRLMRNMIEIITK